MTTAYEANLPCKNPNCKSHGRPHPNCKCYAGMAEGGDVDHYCSKPQDHKAECEYFSDGAPAGALVGVDPYHATAGHIAHHGLIGMLRLDHDQDLNKYERAVSRGHKTLDEHLEHIFGGKHPPAPEDRAKHHDAIDKWVMKGGIGHHVQQDIYNQNDAVESFAKGGEVKPKPLGIMTDHPVATVYPDQNIALQEAKGRVSQYLGSLKPQPHAPKLPFDDEPSQKDQKRSYMKAIKVADRPLSVLHEISRGTVDAEDVKHLQAIYPEVHEAMKKKITEKIIHAQLDGKKPNYKVRQGMSLLMGVPLSTDLTPAGIQAAQAVFANNKKQQQQGGEAAPAGKPKRSTSTLSKSDAAFLTGAQALQKRQQRPS